MALHLSLRAKGVLAVAVLLLYLAAIAVFLHYERLGLLPVVRQIETNQANQALLAPIVNSLAHSLVEIQSVLNAPELADGRPVAFAEFGSHVEPIEAGLERAQQLNPTLEPEVAAFRRADASMHASPTNGQLALLRDREQGLIVRLHDVLTGLSQRSIDLAQRYQDRQQFISVFAISANIVGAVASVAVIMIFFTKLAGDIKRLQHRAAAIVAGYEGAPLPNTRHDEVGGLIDAVNCMQVDLRRSERQLEITRQQRFHHEKMAAVGALAAGIAHEVNNPIAAISGVAQFIIEETKGDQPAIAMVGAFAAQIVKETERIALIMRQMSTLTARRSPDPELLDLNALVQSTWKFVRYDSRFAEIEFEEDLVPDLPAITAVADHLIQILMNLLTNAADALDYAKGARRGTIRIATRIAGDEVELSVSDNGRGMTADVLAKAFEESFTTKPAGKGRGIGLFVCKTLVEQAGGRVALVSKLDEGTTANLRLPLRPPELAPA